MDIWDVPASFLAGVLTGTGIGGGGLVVIYLTLFRATDHLRAQWLNLTLFISASLFSVPYHLARRKAAPGLIALFSAAAIPGTLAGYAVRSVLPVAAIRRIFGGMLVLTGALVLFRRRKKGDGASLFRTSG